MNRREWVLAILGAWLVTGALLKLSNLSAYTTDSMYRGPGWENILLDGKGCSIPASYLHPLFEQERGTVVVLHGLGANRKIMLIIGRWFAANGLGVYLLDLPGHGDSVEPFSFARSEECAARAIETLVRRKQIALEKTVLLGHSMGGALAIRMADYFPTLATIAISPAPMLRVEGMPPGAVLLVPPRRMPGNLRIIIGQFDLPFARDAADKLARLAGSERQGPEDFEQRRAVRISVVSGATHTSLLYSYGTWLDCLGWVRSALKGEGWGEMHHFYPGLGESISGFVGILCLFPFSASLVASGFAFKREKSQPTEHCISSAAWRWGVAAVLGSVATYLVLWRVWVFWPVRDLLPGFPFEGLVLLVCTVLLSESCFRRKPKAHKMEFTKDHEPLQSSILRWAVAGTFSVSVLNFVEPLRFLKMYNGDYLASCLLFTGTVLCALLWFTLSKNGGVKPPLPWRAIAAGAVMGMATMLAFGAWMNWTLTDTWLNTARWMRFPVVLLACLPYALAEEWALGAPGAGNWLAKIRRYFLFGILRLLIWLSIVFALYFYASGQILLSVLVVYLGSFSVLTRLGADAVRRRTGSPAGAAVFTAILMAWFIAAVFPIT